MTFATNSQDVTADAAHTRLGTLEYLPPEVLVTGAPNSDPRRVAMDPCRADLYCMGVCLYTMLARQYPWVTREEQTKNPMALVPLMVSRMQRGALTRPPDVPDGCWALLQGLLQVDPARRFGIEDIRTVLGKCTGFSYWGSWGQAVNAAAEHFFCTIHRMNGFE